MKKSDSTVEDNNNKKKKEKHSMTLIPITYVVKFIIIHHDYKFNGHGFQSYNTSKVTASYSQKVNLNLNLLRKKVYLKNMKMIHLVLSVLNLRMLKKF